jgi:hypothetical protein
MEARLLSPREEGIARTEHGLEVKQTQPLFRGKGWKKGRGTSTANGPNIDNKRISHQEHRLRGEYGSSGGRVEDWWGPEEGDESALRAFFEIKCHLRLMTIVSPINDTLDAATQIHVLGNAALSDTENMRYLCFIQVKSMCIKDIDY